MFRRPIEKHFLPRGAWRLKMTRIEAHVNYARRRLGSLRLLRNGWYRQEFEPGRPIGIETKMFCPGTAYS